MIKNKIIIALFLIGMLITFNSCKVKEYIEVPVEKVKTEYVHIRDSVYLHDSVSIYIEQKGDTIFVDRYKYKVKEVYKTDTIHKIDSIPKIVSVNKIVEVNKLYSWQKILMWMGGVGVIGLFIFLIVKFSIWKLPF